MYKTKKRMKMFKGHNNKVKYNTSQKQKQVKTLKIIMKQNYINTY